MAPEAASGRAALIGGGVALAGALAYIGLADPHRPGFLFPACPFKALTGLDCPACGGLRMTHDLLHGDLGAAVMDNVFLLVGLPLLALWLLVRWRRGRPLMPVAASVTVVAAAVAWTVLRNWPGFPLVPTLLSG
ncbi:DUF2752 domain-containing protein [Mycobacterium sp. AMU20-3851]|jgi:hypothetical protein|uniref:DUF2752 domain-containing protein n=1 Tax=Mycobacterium sp. AMU20-3851 TaxID=3122055 RepID=UPI003755406C